MKMKELGGGKTSRACTGKKTWVIAVLTGPVSAVNWCAAGTTVTFIPAKFSSILMFL